MHKFWNFKFRVNEENSFKNENKIVKSRILKFIIIYLNNPHNHTIHTEQSNSAGENLHNQNFDKKSRILCSDLERRLYKIVINGVA